MQLSDGQGLQADGALPNRMVTNYFHMKNRKHIMEITINGVLVCLTTENNGVGQTTITVVGPKDVLENAFRVAPV